MTFGGLGLRVEDLDIEVFGVAAQDAQRDGADPYAAQREAFEIGRVVVRAARERLVELAELDVAGVRALVCRRNHVQSHFVEAFFVEEAEELVGAGYHLEVAAIAFPRHVDIPAAVGVLNEGEGILVATVGEDSLYILMDYAEIFNKIYHFFLLLSVKL